MPARGGARTLFAALKRDNVDIIHICDFPQRLRVVVLKGYAEDSCAAAALLERALARKLASVLALQQHATLPLLHFHDVHSATTLGWLIATTFPACDPHPGVRVAGLSGAQAALFTRGRRDRKAPRALRKVV